MSGDGLEDIVKEQEVQAMYVSAPRTIPKQANWGWLAIIGLIYFLFFRKKQRKARAFRRKKRKLNKYNKGFFKLFPDERGSTRTGSVYSALKRGRY